MIISKLVIILQEKSNSGKYSLRRSWGYNSQNFLKCEYYLNEKT